MAGYRRPWQLTWDEVDPARHSLDTERIPDIVRTLPATRVFPTRPPGAAGDGTVLAWSRKQGAQWVEAITVDLVRHYGAWASGWLYARGGGGPVTAWCCPRDSITTAEVTLARVAEALVQWRTWLVDVADAFDRLLPSPEITTVEARRLVWERAVSALVTLVVERTGADDAWYYHCEQVLEWFLTRAGVRQDDTVAALVTEAIGGRFESWTAPEPKLIVKVAARIAAGASPAQDG